MVASKAILNVAFGSLYLILFILRAEQICTLPFVPDSEIYRIFLVISIGNVNTTSSTDCPSVYN
jgi:hypothetical protein